jgi:hypothetical protein
MTDNGLSYVSHPAVHAQANDEAERFIRRLLREWASARPYISAPAAAPPTSPSAAQLQARAPQASPARQAPSTWFQLKPEQPARSHKEAPEASVITLRRVLCDASKSGSQGVTKNPPQEHPLGSTISARSKQSVLCCRKQLLVVAENDPLRALGVHDRDQRVGVAIAQSLYDLLLRSPRMRG